MTGLGIATDVLVNDGIVMRTREGDRVVLETPARRDFWFGHGFVLDAPPDAARAAAIIDEGRTRFAALGAARFVIEWEGALDAPGASFAPPDGALFERTVMMVYDGPVPTADARVADHDDDSRWDEAAALASEEYPQHGSFTGWRFGCVREAVADVLRTMDNNWRPTALLLNRRSRPGRLPRAGRGGCRWWNGA